MSKFRRFAEAFTSTGTVWSVLGTAIHVSADGTTSVPASALDGIIRKRFQDMRAPHAAANGRADETPEKTG